MKSYYYRFLIFGFRPKKPFIFKGLKFYTPKSSRSYSVIETIRRTNNLSKIRQKVDRLLDLLRIFYLGRVTSYGIYLNKSKKSQDWQFLEIYAPVPVSALQQYPMYEERYVTDFLKFTFNKRKYRERIYKSNILLINARTPGILFEVKFLLRWVAFESLLREERMLKATLTKQKFTRLKAAAESFAEQSISSEELKKIFMEKINRTKEEIQIRKAVKKFVAKRMLPVRYEEDIKDCKDVRDIIVHYGTIHDIKKNLKKYNDLSNRMEALVRNLTMYYLGLRFNPDWKIWYAWTNSSSQPKKR